MSKRFPFFPSRDLNDYWRVPFELDEDIIKRWQHMTGTSFCIAETNFSAGLNFLAIYKVWLDYAPPDTVLYYYANESRPFTKESLREILGKYYELTPYSQALLSVYPTTTPGFHIMTLANGRIRLILMLGDAVVNFRELLICGDQQLESTLRRHYMNIWLLHENDMNNNCFLSSLSLLSQSNPYVICTNTKQKIQFENIETSKRLRVTPWHMHNQQSSSCKKVIVIGAGLAGCLLSHALAKRGWKVTLLEQRSNIAQGASGNPQAIIYPKLSGYHSPLTQFMLDAYLYAHQFYSRILTEHAVGELKGIIQFAYSQKELLTQKSLVDWLNNYPELGQLLQPENISELAGIDCEKSGIYLPLSGWIDTPAVCQLLLQHPAIDFVAGSEVTYLSHVENTWVINDYAAETLVLANGYQVNNFEQTSHLPIKAMAGQLTWVNADNHSSKLRLPLCGDGHVLPKKNSQHLVGATYHQNKKGIDNHLDDLVNLQRFNAYFPGLEDKPVIAGNWRGVRAATPDYLPLVGPAPHEKDFLASYQALAKDAKRWLSHAGSYHPGLYIFAGFGSRGLTSIPLAAEHLAGLINQEPVILPRYIEKALSPARFLIKKIS